MTKTQFVTMQSNQGTLQKYRGQPERIAPTCPLDIVISVRDGQSVAPALIRVNEGCRNQEQIQVVYEI